MLSLTDIQTLLAETKQSLEEAQKTFLEQSKLLEQKSAELQATLNMNAILELRLTTENQLRSEAASRALDSAAEVEQLSARVAKLEVALKKIALGRSEVFPTQLANDFELREFARKALESRTSVCS